MLERRVDLHDRPPAPLGLVHGRRTAPMRTSRPDAPSIDAHRPRPAARVGDSPLSGANAGRSTFVAPRSCATTGWTAFSWTRSTMTRRIARLAPTIVIGGATTGSTARPAAARAQVRGPRLRQAEWSGSATDGLGRVSAHRPAARAHPIGCAGDNQRCAAMPTAERRAASARARCGRFVGEPRQPVQAGRRSGSLIQRISSVAATPISSRPLRMICPIPSASSSRARESCGLFSMRKRRSGSSLPRFHSA